MIPRTPPVREATTPTAEPKTRMASDVAGSASGVGSWIQVFEPRSAMTTPSTFTSWPLTGDNTLFDGSSDRNAPAKLWWTMQSSGGHELAGVCFPVVFVFYLVFSFFSKVPAPVAGIGQNNRL